MSDVIIRNVQRSMYLPSDIFISERNLSNLFQLFPVQIFLTIEIQNINNSWFLINKSDFFNNLKVFCLSKFDELFTFQILRSDFKNIMKDYNSLSIEKGLNRLLLIVFIRTEENREIFIKDFCLIRKLTDESEKNGTKD